LIVDRGKAEFLSFYPADNPDTFARQIIIRLLPHAYTNRNGKNMSKGIRTVEIKKDADGNYKHVRLVFGPHYFVELHCDANDVVSFVLGATHHGFKADASEVAGELEKFIGEIRAAHPKNLVD
jgi:hypothetical protein